MKLTGLEHWSWHGIIRTYQIYGRMLHDFQIIKNLSIDNGVPVGDFEKCYTKYIEGIDAGLQILDEEIARRNKLIGVM